MIKLGYLTSQEIYNSYYFKNLCEQRPLPISSWINLKCTMPWDDGLEGPPKNIAGFKGKYLRVKAGPGTGKTYALMRRVSRLLEEGVTPSTILAISFTKTAANDLIKQLNGL